MRFYNKALVIACIFNSLLFSSAYADKNPSDLRKAFNECNSEAVKGYDECVGTYYKNPDDYLDGYLQICIEDFRKWNALCSKIIFPPKKPEIQLDHENGTVPDPFARPVEPLI